MKAVNGFKVCSRCKSLFSVVCFGRDKYKSDGLKSYCKECGRKYLNDWVARNREIVNAKHRKYYQTWSRFNKNKIKNYYLKHRDSNNAKRREQRRRNPEKHRLWAKRYRDRNKIKVYETYKLWLSRNKAHVREYGRRLYSKLKSNPDWFKKRRTQQRICQSKKYRPSHSTARFFQTLSAIETIKRELTNANTGIAKQIHN